VVTGILAILMQMDRSMCSKKITMHLYLALISFFYAYPAFAKQVVCEGSMISKGVRAAFPCDDSRFNGWFISVDGKQWEAITPPVDLAMFVLSMDYGVIPISKREVVYLAIRSGRWIHVKDGVIVGRFTVMDDSSYSVLTGLRGQEFRDVWDYYGIKSLDDGFNGLKQLTLLDGICATCRLGKDLHMIAKLKDGTFAFLTCGSPQSEPTVVKLFDVKSGINISEVSSLRESGAGGFFAFSVTSRGFLLEFPANTSKHDEIKFPDEFGFINNAHYINGKLIVNVIKSLDPMEINGNWFVRDGGDYKRINHPVMVNYEKFIVTLNDRISTQPAPKEPSPPAKLKGK
jgi:hypothetical protein